MNLKNFTRFFLLLLISIPAAIGQTTSEPVLPDTPAAKRVTAFIKAFNTGDQKTMRDFHANNTAEGVFSKISMDEISRMDSQMYSDFGGFDLRRIIESNNTDITVLLQAKKGPWLQMRCEVEQNPPHKLIGIGLQPAEAPKEMNAKPASSTNTNSTGAATAKAADGEIIVELEKFLDQQVKADAFSGTVVLAKDGKPVFQKAYGLASKSFNAPNNIDTKFNLGSMNKMITAVAITQLVERGKLSFDDKVGKIIPDFPNKAIAEKVTVHHLLTHTSGMGSYFNEKYFETSKDRFKKVEDYSPLYVNDTLQFEPGSKWEYSNSGFMLLGLLIEKVTGQTYFDYVRENIYKPAGMTNTDCYELDTDTPNLAIGYTNSGPDGRPTQGPRKNNLFLHVVKGGPAGGGFSTAPDLLRFDIALRSNKLLSQKSFDTLVSGKVDMSQPGIKYAYGFFDRRTDGIRIVGHSGGFPGINSQLDMYLDSGYTVAVMSNYDPPAAQRVAGKIRQLLTK